MQLKGPGEQQLRGDCYQKICTGHQLLSVVGVQWNGSSHRHSSLVADQVIAHQMLI